MSSIQIRDVPDGLHSELRARASAAGVSLSDYLLDELRRVAARPPIADVLRRATDRDWGVPAGVGVAALRELRDDR